MSLPLFESSLQPGDLFGGDAGVGVDTFGLSEFGDDQFGMQEFVEDVAIFGGDDDVDSIAGDVDDLDAALDAENGDAYGEDYGLADERVAILEIRDIFANAIGVAEVLPDTLATEAIMIAKVFKRHIESSQADWSSMGRDGQIGFVRDVVRDAIVEFPSISDTGSKTAAAAIEQAWEDDTSGYADQLKDLAYGIAKALKQQVTIDLPANIRSIVAAMINADPTDSFGVNNLAFLLWAADKLQQSGISNSSYYPQIVDQINTQHLVTRANIPSEIDIDGVVTDGRSAPSSDYPSEDRAPSTSPFGMMRPQGWLAVGYGLSFLSAILSN